MPIPKEEYKIAYGNIDYVTMEQIEKYHTKEEVNRFNLWFRGQTGIISDDGDVGIYRYDYERWLEAGMPPQQGKDWD